jgi:hypothetical protein
MTGLLFQAAMLTSPWWPNHWRQSNQTIANTAAACEISPSLGRNVGS